MDTGVRHGDRISVNRLRDCDLHDQSARCPRAGVLAGPRELSKRTDGDDFRFGGRSNNLLHNQWIAADIRFRGLLRSDHSVFLGDARGYCGRFRILDEPRCQCAVPHQHFIDPVHLHRGWQRNLRIQRRWRTGCPCRPQHSRRHCDGQRLESLYCRRGQQCRPQGGCGYRHHHDHCWNRHRRIQRRQWSGNERTALRSLLPGSGQCGQPVYCGLLQQCRPVGECNHGRDYNLCRHLCGWTVHAPRG